ncbi:MAG: hypothetical protein AB8H80_20200 [Planctomycetota bacterium]
MLTCIIATHSLDDLPFNDPPTRTKITHFTEVSPEIDTLFIGSSRLLRGISPKVFDTATAERGIKTTSYNAAQAGIQPHDYDVWIDWVLENRPPRLTRVFIELGEWSLGNRPATWMKDKTVDMHSPSHLHERLWTAVNTSENLSEFIRQTNWALAHTAVNLFNIGRGIRIFDDTLREHRNLPPDTPRNLTQGFGPLSDRTAPAQRLAFSKQWHAKPKKLKWLRKAKTENTIAPPSNEAGFTEGFERQARRLRQAGLEPIFVLPPVYSKIPGRSRLLEIRSVARVFELDRPTTYPELYDTKHWFDAQHLRESGAIIFSSQLAAEFAAN